MWGILDSLAEVISELDLAKPSDSFVFGCISTTSVILVIFNSHFLNRLNSYLNLWKGPLIFTHVIILVTYASASTAYLLSKGSELLRQAAKAPVIFFLEILCCCVACLFQFTFFLRYFNHVRLNYLYHGNDLQELKRRLIIAISTSLLLVVLSLMEIPLIFSSLCIIAYVIEFMVLQRKNLYHAEFFMVALNAIAGTVISLASVQYFPEAMKTRLGDNQGVLLACVFAPVILLELTHLGLIWFLPEYFGDHNFELANRLAAVQVIGQRGNGAMLRLGLTESLLDVDPSLLLDRLHDDILRDIDIMVGRKLKRFSGNKLKRFVGKQRKRQSKFTMVEDGETHEPECPICFQEISTDPTSLTEVIQIKKCKHFFHTPCLSSWLQKQLNCPVCRKDILPEQEVCRSPQQPERVPNLP